MWQTYMSHPMCGEDCRQRRYEGVGQSEPLLQVSLQRATEQDYPGIQGPPGNAAKPRLSVAAWRDTKHICISFAGIGWKCRDPMDICGQAKERVQALANLQDLQ